MQNRCIIFILPTPLQAAASGVWGGRGDKIYQQAETRVRGAFNFPVTTLAVVNFQHRIWPCYSNLISNSIVSYPSLELRLFPFARLPHLSFAERNSSPGQSLLSPQMCTNLLIYLKLHSIGTTTQKTGQEKLPHVFLNQPSPKTRSELQMSSIPVTVSNFSSYKGSHKPPAFRQEFHPTFPDTQTIKKHQLHPRDVPSRQAITTSNIVVSSGHDQTWENKGLRYDTYDEDPRFRNMTLSYWVIGPRRFNLTTFLHLQGFGGLTCHTSRPLQTPDTDYPAMRFHTPGREDVHTGMTLSRGTGTGRDTQITDYTDSNKKDRTLSGDRPFNTTALCDIYTRWRKIT
jgi:hypothetical protein